MSDVLHIDGPNDEFLQQPDSKGDATLYRKFTFTDADALVACRQLSAKLDELEVLAKKSNGVLVWRFRPTLLFNPDKTFTALCRVAILPEPSVEDIVKVEPVHESKQPPKLETKHGN